MAKKITLTEEEYAKFLKLTEAIETTEVEEVEEVDEAEEATPDVPEGKQESIIDEKLSQELREAKDKINDLEEKLKLSEEENVKWRDSFNKKTEAQKPEPKTKRSGW